MDYVIIVVSVLSLLVGTIYELRQIDVRHLKFSDGILIGATYYLVCPLIVILIQGDLTLPDIIGVAPYKPFEDWLTTFNLLVGWLLILSFHYLFRVFRQRVSEQKTTSSRERAAFLLFLGLLVSLEVFNFFVSGKAEGGHWQHNLAQQFEDNTFLIVTFNIANAYRAMIFGYLIYMVVARFLLPKTAAIIGALIVLLDVALTFNRITAAYYAIAVLIIYRHRMLYIILGIIPILPAVAYASSVWSTFRGLALYRGLSVENLLIALSTAQRSVTDTTSGVSGILNAICEAGNILVFKYLVDNTPNQFPLLYGSTFILKSLGFFVPSTFWSDKPSTFGVYLGYYIQSIQGLALNSTLFGEAYGNFYYFWPLLLLLMLVVLELIFASIARRIVANGFLSCFVGIGLWRFEMTFAFISMIAIACFGLTRLLVPYLSGINPRSARTRYKRLRGYSDSSFRE